MGTSSFTPNEGIEQPLTGTQAGQWGVSLNNNFARIDAALDGIIPVVLTGSNVTLTTSLTGGSSNGRGKIIQVSGVISSPATITIAPNTIQKLHFVVNGSSRAVTINQGTGNTVSIPAGFSKPVFCDGGGAGANVFEAHPINSDQVVEGTTNFFYTPARAQGAISVSTTAGDAMISYASGVITSQFWAEPWQTLPLTSNFTAYGSPAPRYRMANNNRVHLNGAFKSTVPVTNAEMLVATLPVGRRPAYMQYLPCPIWNSLPNYWGVQAEGLRIDTAGNMYCSNPGDGTVASVNFSAFSGLSFALD